MSKPSRSQSKKAVTIKDIAARAETSIATVSYALSNEIRYLRPELRERVLKAANDLGYVKNAAASSLKGKQRGIVAIVMAQFGNSFFTRMCVSIEAVARQAGYIVTICNNYEDPNLEHLILERLIAQRIDGCILSSALSQEANAAFLQQHQIPFVILERSLVSSFPSHDFVGQDNFHSGYLATKRLLDAGHRIIAFTGWKSPIPNIHERVDGYRAALREYGVPTDQELILLGELSQATGQKMAEKLLLSEVTAVVLGDQEIAKGTLKHFQDKDVGWPNDISLVLIGTPAWSAMIRPSLTCIQRPEHEMGYVAATLLLKKMQNPDHTEVQKLLPCTIVEGRSVRSIQLRR